jgi:glycosyltransferase involved in cell wall biosynthesis
MILLTHPVGCTMVRQSIQGLFENKMLKLYVTTLGWSSKSFLFKSLFFKSLKKSLKRRAYNLPPAYLCTDPTYECFRLFAQRIPFYNLMQHAKKSFNIDTVCMKHDRFSARMVKKHASELKAVYAYEDCALNTFLTAKSLGLKCIYELPIAYWKVSHQILKEEAERLPAWKATLIGNKDSAEKLQRKTQELELADHILCPSEFVYNTLPKEFAQKCTIIPYGAPTIIEQKCRMPGKLRFLFAGELSQRKGLADLFEAIKLLKVKNAAEWVVFGSLLQPLDFYRKQFQDFKYEPPRANQALLELMLECDVLVLPSLVEGRAIVQLEALACGLPLIITPNTGGTDLVQEAVTGFVVPIRSPAAIAEKLEWFIDNQHLLPFMSLACRKKAQQVSWKAFRNQLVTCLNTVVNPEASKRDVHK